MDQALFPFAHYWSFYLIFSGAIIGLLAIDLTAHRKAQTISMRAAGVWVCVWVALALLFCAGLFEYCSVRFGGQAARRVGLEFLAGYVMEESLSVDNMFVFALVFRYFAIPARYQHRVLFYGVLGAMVFRGMFIAAGSALMRFHWVVDRVRDLPRVHRHSDGDGEGKGSGPGRESADPPGAAMVPGDGRTAR